MTNEAKADNHEQGNNPAPAEKGNQEELNGKTVECNMEDHADLARFFKVDLADFKVVSIKMTKIK